MHVITRLGRAFWTGLLLMALAVAVWFVAPQLQSCPPEIDFRDCDTTWVVALNVVGLMLFVVGGGLMLYAGGLARSRARRQALAEGDDTR